MYFPVLVTVIKMYLKINVIVINWPNFEQLLLKIFDAA